MNPKTKEQSEAARAHSLDDFDTLEQAKDLEDAQNLDYPQDPLAAPDVEQRFAVGLARLLSNGGMLLSLFEMGG